MTSPLSVDLRERVVSAVQGVATSTSSLSRFLAPHRITRKKGLSTPPSRTVRT